MCKIETQSECTGLSVEQLLSRSQKESVCFARYLCWDCLFKNKTSYSEIARMYGRDSHSTIISGINSIQDMRDTNNPKYVQAIKAHKCFSVAENMPVQINATIEVSKHAPEEDIDELILNAVGNVILFEKLVSRRNAMIIRNSVQR